MELTAPEIVGSLIAIGTALQCLRMAGVFDPEQWVDPYRPERPTSYTPLYSPDRPADAALNRSMLELSDDEFVAQLQDAQDGDDVAMGRQWIVTDQAAGQTQEVQTPDEWERFKGKKLTT